MDLSTAVPAGRATVPEGLGLVLPTFPQRAAVPDAASLAQVCRRAEAAGAVGLWACDHLYWHGHNLECMTALAMAAGATERTALGTCVLQLPLRDAPTVAKSASALQHLSGGRFVLGVGVGTHAGEYEACGVPFAGRGRLLDAKLTELRTAWNAGAGHYRQLPVPERVPVWVGGSSEAALGRAARHDGWIPLFVSPERYGAGLARVRADVERSGGDPSRLAAGIVAFVSLGVDGAEAGEAGAGWMASLYGLPPRSFARHLLAGTPAAVAGALLRWVEQGARHVVAFVTDDHPESQFEDLSGELARRWAWPSDGDREACDHEPVPDMTPTAVPADRPAHGAGRVPARHTGAGVR